MFSKNAEVAATGSSWSITRRLILLYTVSACAILAAATVLLYLGVQGGFADRRDAFLRDEINVLRATIEQDEASLHREIALEYKEMQFIRHFIRLLDADGRVLAQTPKMSEILAPEDFPPPSHSLYGQKLEKWTPEGYGFLLRSAWVETKGETRILQVAMDITPGNQLLARIRRNLAFILLAGVLASTLAAKYITRRGLAPLARINEATRDISVSNLDVRISSPEWPRELHDLAVSFDQMLDRLQDSFARLSHCTSNLAHELRTPINNLMGEAEVLLGRERTPEEYRQALESSLEEYGRLSRIFDSLLFLARAENGVTTLERARVDVRQELENIRDYYEAVAEAGGVQLACEGEGVLNGDRSLFRRAVGNLVENALKHTQAGGRIDLNVRSSPQGTLVCIEDTGCGIAAGHLPLLFDRFYRVEDTRQGGGVGLGLAIVRSIMELHGGSVRFQSEPGAGTAVTLYFPPSA